MNAGYEARFGGIARLFGQPAQERVRRARVCVVGLGGVGSWTVEALARSGVGELALVDLDDVCISNVNRQLHAVVGQYGRPKVDVVQERILAIHPDCTVRPLRAFFTAANADQILEGPFDYLVDAIDSPSLKCLLIARCRARDLPVVTVGGAGGRRDPTAVRVSDLAFSTHDALLQEVRRGLRRDHGFPRGPQPFGAACVFSTERQVFPAADGSVCAERPADADLRLDCRRGFGTASFVTGAFGFAAAAVVMRHLSGG
jgi:tRNA A37 threonylcarbamoyladenosine dehydratase